MQKQKIKKKLLYIKINQNKTKLRKTKRIYNIKIIKQYI